MRLPGCYFGSVKTSFRDYDVDFARGVVSSGGSTFGRIAVCVKVTAESACLFGGALSGIEIHEIPAGTDGLVRWVALGVKRHEMLPGSGFPLGHVKSSSR